MVLWRERRDGSGRRLTAYFQSDGAPPALVSHSQLRDFLRETLPEDLIPAAFVPVERFPADRRRPAGRRALCPTAGAASVADRGSNITMRRT